MRSPSSEPSVAPLILGAQRPRISHVPAYASTAGDEAIALALLAGLELDDWQQWVLRESLGERPDGKWSAPTVGLVVGRQNGKNAILEARELYGLFVLNEQLIIHSAHEQKTASEHFRRLLKRIRSTPKLAERMLKPTAGKGSEAIELKSGARIMFTTRTGGGGRGLTVDLIVYDEAMHLTEDERSAVAPTMAAQSMTGNTQTWYTGSAVDQQNPKHDGRPLAQIRRAGMSGASRVAYFEWSAPGDDPSSVSTTVAADVHIWALANPGMNIRISSSWIEHERTIEMGPRGFAVERLGIGDWPEPDEGYSVISAEAWAALEDPALELHSGIAFALDVSPDRRHAAMAAAGRRKDLVQQVEIGEHRAGTDWIVPRAEQLVEKHGSVTIAVDGRGPAASLIAELEAVGVTVVQANSQDMAQACGQFFDGVMHGTFRHRGSAELRAAVKGATQRTLGDAWAWDRRSSSVDISPLVAATLALWAARDLGGESSVMAFTDEELAEIMGEDV